MQGNRDGGTGAKANAVGNSYSLHPRQARLSSTLSHGHLLAPRLQGYGLAGGEYQELPTRKLASNGLAVRSEALTLELRLEEGRLRLWDPLGQRCLLTYEEEKAAREAAEDRARAAEEAREQADARERQALEARLAELEAILESARLG